MAPELTRSVQRWTFVLLAISAAAVEIAAVDTRPVVQSLGLAVVWIILVAVIGSFLPLPTDPRQRPPNRVVLLLLALAAAPFAVEPLRREWLGDGYPLELQMVFSLRNLGLGLAVCGGWLLCLRLACVVSLFLTLFAAAMTNHPAVLTLLTLYTAAGSLWLMLVYWGGLKSILVAPERAVAVETQPGREPLPWVAGLVVVVLVSGVLTLIAVGPREAAWTLGEWLPTSGGTGGYDPFARGGVNDGDDETNGNNPKSTGMTQTDTFLESPLPSLYDYFNDQYGEPFKPKDQERSVALDPSVRTVEGKKRPADNLRPNREFPTVRKSPRAPRDPSSRAARALFEVQGRTPLHVRVTAYDTFDGQTWREAPVKPGGVRIEKEANSNWMTLYERRPSPIFAELDYHQFKLTAPEGALIPTPTHLTRFRIGRVDQADFFAWSQDRILKFAERNTPSGVVVETECRTVEPRKLVEQAFAESKPEDVQVSRGVASEALELARAWTEGTPRGWPQIHAVVHQLRTEYLLDREYVVPSGCTDPLGHFLLESRRGPDYQFASAATLLLRVLGYSTRQVAGFYVDPDHYDRQTKHTPVVAEDVHFWTEVQLPSGDWMVIEPTPGYEVLGPRQSLSEWITGAAFAVAAWVEERSVALGVLTLALVGVGVWRRELLDAVAVGVWTWFPGRTWREQVRGAVTILERRGRWAGMPRTPRQTTAAWLRTARPCSAATDADLEHLRCMAEWAAYAPHSIAPWSALEVESVCRRVLISATLRQWRSGKVSFSGTGACD